MGANNLIVQHCRSKNLDEHETGYNYVIYLYPAILTHDNNIKLEVHHMDIISTIMKASEEEASPTRIP